MMQRGLWRRPSAVSRRLSHPGPSEPVVVNVLVNQKRGPGEGQATLGKALQHWFGYTATPSVAARIHPPRYTWTEN